MFILQYWLSKGLWRASFKNSQVSAPLKSPHPNYVSTRTHQIWPKMSLIAKWYEGNLKIDNFERETLVAHPARKVLGMSARWVICSQVKSRTSARMHSVRAHVMPSYTVTLREAFKKKSKSELFPNWPGAPPPSLNLNRNFWRKKKKLSF